MSNEKDCRIFLASGETRDVSAPSLRTALRQLGKQVPETSVVAAIERDCLPIPEDDARPFLAVLLKNPRYPFPIDE